MKNMTERGKIAVEKWNFRGQKGVIGPEKSRVATQTRKAKWCKMRVLFLKMDRVRGVKDSKWYQFNYF